MITGKVEDLRVLVGVTFLLSDQTEIVIECVVDTGFAEPSSWLPQRRL